MLLDVLWPMAQRWAGDMRYKERHYHDIAKTFSRLSSLSWLLESTYASLLFGVMSLALHSRNDVNSYDLVMHS